jgi:hypothetical protein
MEYEDLPPGRIPLPSRVRLGYINDMIWWENKWCKLPIEKRVKMFYRIKIAHEQLRASREETQTIRKQS